MKKSMKVLSMILVLIMMSTVVACNSSKDDTSDTVDEAAGSNETDVDTTDGDSKNEEVEDTKDDETQSDVVDSDLSYEGELLFTGLSEELSIPYNEIFAMEAVKADVHHISSSGEEFQDTVTGVTLDTILASVGDSQKNYTSIRFIAGDGYEVTVPAEIVMEKDIILAYEFNGEGLEEKKMPLRVAIDDVRSMYFVSNLVEIAFDLADETSANEVAPTIVLLETAFASIESEDYMYYDSNDKAITLASLFQQFPVNETDNIDFVATDGYEKTEEMTVVHEGFIKFTGEDAPLFTGLDLPKGMNVKSIMTMKVGSSVFLSLDSVTFAIQDVTANGVTGMPADVIADLGGLDVDNYLLTANDGYSVEVTKEALSDAIVYIDDEGVCAIQFSEDYPKNTNVHALATITEANAPKAEDSEESESATEEKEDDTMVDVAAATWVITFDGLEDGSFDMTGEKAGRKLEAVALHTEHTKDEVVKPNDWVGYKVLDILDFLHVEDFESITFIASDGYEVTLTKDEIDDETILAHIQNGEAINSDNPVKLVRNTKLSNTWVKDIVTITVK